MNNKTKIFFIIFLLLTVLFVPSCGEEEPQPTCHTGYVQNDQELEQQFSIKGYETYSSFFGSKNTTIVYYQKLPNSGWIAWKKGNGITYVYTRDNITLEKMQSISWEYLIDMSYLGEWNFN